MTHTLAANCHINNPAWFPRRNSRSHLRNPLSATTFCCRVEQQKGTSAHLLTWPVVNELWVHARILFMKYYKKKKAWRGEKAVNNDLNAFSRPQISKWAVLSVPNCKENNKSREVFSQIRRKRSLHRLNAARWGKMSVSAELCVREVAEQTYAITQPYTHAFSSAPPNMPHASDFHKGRPLERELQ